MTNENQKAFRTVLFVFGLVTTFCLTGKNWLAKQGIDHLVVIGGNLVLLVVSLLATLVLQRTSASGNPNAFVRGLYGSFMIRFFLVAVAAFIYIMVVKKQVNKPALLVCAALYIIYTAIETRGMIRSLRGNKHA